jgi:hypothetical protein
MVIDTIATTVFKEWARTKIAPGIVNSRVASYRLHVFKSIITSLLHLLSLSTQTPQKWKSNTDALQKSTSPKSSIPPPASLKGTWPFKRKKRLGLKNREMVQRVSMRDLRRCA